MPEEFKLEARGKFVGIEVLINELPFIALVDGGAVPGARINHLVVPGSNSVTIRVALASDRPEVRPDSLTAVRVSRDADVLFEHAWNADRDAPALPPETVGSFDADEGVGSWPWLSAPPLTTPLPAAEELHELYERMHKAMSDKDLDGVAALLAHKKSDLAQAFDIDEGRADTNQRSFFADLFGAADWLMEPLTLDGAQHVICGNGRIVHTLTHDNLEPVRTVPDADGFIFSLPILASHFEDGWVIVR